MLNRLMKIPTLTFISGLLGLGLSLTISVPESLAFTVKDSLNPGESIRFFFTDNDDDGDGNNISTEQFTIIISGVPTPIISPGGQSNVFETTQPVTQFTEFEFKSGEGVTDWKQIIIRKDGTRDVFSDVLAANIQQNDNGEFEFEELDLLPNIPWRIPDLFPIGSNPASGIYTAVNYDIYLDNNPLGFNNGNWSTGQTLSELSIEIVNGKVPGLEGIFWSTTPFLFDSNSPTGFVPTGGVENLYTSIGNQTLIGNQHTSVPEPITTLGSITSLCLGLMILKKKQEIT